MMTPGHGVNRGLGSGAWGQILNSEQRSESEVQETLARMLRNHTIVGIELWRATALGFGGGSSSFPPGLSPTPMVHVSIGPPTIPDGRISRVRF